MRILMLNNEFPPFGGGTATVNEMLLRQLAERSDLSIDLITEGLAPETVAFAPSIAVHRVRVGRRSVHHARQRDLVEYTRRALPLSLRLMRQAPYDLCLAWSGVPAGALALALSKLRGLPYAVRIGGSDIPGHEKRYRTAYALLTPLIRSVWRNARTLVVKCGGEADEVRAVDPAARLQVIPNGVDTRVFQPGTGIPEAGPFRLVIVARLIEHKGHRHLFGALRTLASEGFDVVLDVVGTGDAHAALERLAAEMGIAARVAFSGSVPRNAVPAHYQAAHAFVLPSDAEGMSVSTLEAMASGLALVTSRTGGTAELVEEGVNGLTFPPGDERALTAALRRIVADRPLARDMGAASRRKAQHFTWTRVAEQYVALFKDMALKPEAGTREGNGPRMPRISANGRGGSGAAP